MHTDLSILMGLMVAGFVIFFRQESRLKQIIGQLENANETLASILEEVEK